MEFENIKEIISIFENANIDKLKLQDEDYEIILEKNNGISIEEAKRKIISSSKIEETPTETNNKGNSSEKADDYYIFKAPLVGTFYEAPSPSSLPYVKVGDMVEVDQVICIIEAMKMINEIKSPVKGKIVDIMVLNEDLVEFNKPILKIEVEDV